MALSPPLDAAPKTGRKAPSGHARPLRSDRQQAAWGRVPGSKDTDPAANLSPPPTPRPQRLARTPGPAPRMYHPLARLHLGAAVCPTAQVSRLWCAVQGRIRHVRLGGKPGAPTPYGVAFLSSSLSVVSCYFPMSWAFPFWPSGQKIRTFVTTLTVHTFYRYGRGA